MPEILAVTRALHRQISGADVAATLFDLAWRGGAEIAQDGDGRLFLRIDRSQPILSDRVLDEALIRLFDSDGEFRPAARRISLEALDEVARRQAMATGYIRETPGRYIAYGLTGCFVWCVATVGLFAVSRQAGVAMLVLLCAAILVLLVAAAASGGPSEAAHSAWSELHTGERDGLVPAVRDLQLDSIRRWLERQPGRPDWWAAAWLPEATVDDLSRAVLRFARDCQRNLEQLPAPRHPGSTRLAPGPGGGDGGGGC